MDRSKIDNLWLTQINSGLLDTNRNLVYLYDIIDQKHPLYQFRLEKKREPTSREMKEFNTWYCSVIDNEESNLDMKDYFNCWFDKIQVINNIELLTKYKDSLYSTLKSHRNIDNEVQALMKKSYENIEKINSISNN
jgi:hypothetical protein